MSGRWRGARTRTGGGALVGALAVLGACGDGSDGFSLGGDQANLTCSISESEIFNGGPGKDGIPALINPPTTGPGGDGTEYLRDTDRVIGVVVGDEILAIPLNILWWHEIVNLDLGGRKLAVTHCPLTGSSMAFDREPQGGVDFGVSGLLYRNNLIMYDRNTNESLWPQMARGARCGARSGADLVMFPVVEMTWEGWRTLHPGTEVVTSSTGFPRNYQAYPYGDYDRIDNPELLFPLTSIDERRLPKERVLGIPAGDGGVAFPFRELSGAGSVAAIETGEYVVLWNDIFDAAMAFDRDLDGEALDFVSSGGVIMDVQTGSTWEVDGRAVAGPLAGRRLEAVPDAYVAYWFAWAVFQPNTVIWRAP